MRSVGSGVDRQAAGEVPSSGSGGAMAVRRPETVVAPLSHVEVEFSDAAACLEVWAEVELARIEDEGRQLMFNTLLRRRNRYWVADEIDVLRRSFGL